jgi:hypothetical protein
VLLLAPIPFSKCTEHKNSILKEIISLKFNGMMSHISVSTGPDLADGYNEVKLI